MSQLRGVTSIDSDGQRVTVLPGTRITELGDPLWNHGLSLRNQGDIDAQQVAGAVSTATHGSGFLLQNMSAAVVGLRLATADGNVLKVDESRPDLLAAAQVSIGMLGVITELTLALRPAFSILERVEHWDLAELKERWTGLFQSAHHVSLHYYPTAKAHELFDFPAPESGPGGEIVNMKDLTRVTICDVVDEAELSADDSVHGRCGRPYRIYPQHCEPNFHELEYMVDFDAGFDPVHDLLDVMKRFPEQAIFPVEMRCTDKDDAFLSPDFGRRSLVLSVSGQPGTEYLPFFRAVHDVLVPYGARPHWGRLHLFTREELERALPRYGDFVKVREALDPHGTFLNPTLQGLFG